jgi:hypothetical protein
MMKNKPSLLLLLFCSLAWTTVHSQSEDSSTIKPKTSFSGTVGITNNGFSIIPTFSLNSPAFIINLAWKRKRLSFEPDIRLVPKLNKGGLIWWLRYRIVDNKKFSFRVGAHPAFSLIRKPVTDNGVDREITEMLRFFAFEAVPSVTINKNLGLSAMYLEGHGLQKHGPQITRVLFLNTNITDLKIGEKLRLGLFPSVFFLNTDGYRGDYFTFTGAITHKQWPLVLQSTINKTLQSNVPGNKDFMWNVLLGWKFGQ